MFHKEGSSSQNSNSDNNKKKKAAVDVALRKSDRRKLRATALEYFAATYDSTEPLQEILDSVFLQDNLLVRKLTNHPQLNRVQLYFRGPSSSTENGESSTATENTITQWPYTETTECVWLSIDLGPAEEALECPSVALWSVLPPPTLSQEVVVVPPPVSKFLCRGAHLMCAGIRQLPSGKSGSIVPICIQGNPQPFAVGRQMVNDFVSDDGESKSGIGVQVYTCYGDDLFQSTTSSTESASLVNPWGGAPYSNGHYGNVGFLNGSLVQAILQNSDATEEEEEEDSNNIPAAAEGTANELNTSSGNEEPAAAIESKEVENHDTNKNNDADATPKFSPDEVLHQCVCQALVNIKDKDLPMLTSTFYANHVLQQQQQEKIELKRTRWKKLGNYLLQHCQEELELLTIKRTTGQEFLQTINRRHMDLRGVQKSITATSSAPTKISIVNLYIIPNHIATKLRLKSDDVKATNAKSVERQGTGMLTIKEARELLEIYCNDNGLLTEDNMDVTLDGPLTDVFYTKNKKQQHTAATTTPEFVSRKEAQELWISRLESAYAMVQMPGSIITHLARGKPPQIQMDVSRAKGNKFVTRVRGLEYYFSSPGIADDFVTTFTRIMACAGQVEREMPLWGPLPKGHTELVLQGHWLEEVQAILLHNSSNQHGGVTEVVAALKLPPVPKQVITVRPLKKGIPVRKRK